MNKFLKDRVENLKDNNGKIVDTAMFLSNRRRTITAENGRKRETEATIDNIYVGDGDRLQPDGFVVEAHISPESYLKYRTDIQ